MSSILILKLVLSGFSIFMFLRSLFYLIRVYKDIKISNLILLVSGISLMLYNLSQSYHNTDTIEFRWILADIINAYVYYIVAMNSKDKFATLGSIFKMNMTRVEEDVLDNFKSPEPDMITKESLDALPVGEVYSLDSKVQFEKVEDHNGSYHFVTTMKPGGSFNIHHHDCYEMCIPYIGELICPTKGGKNRFRKNEPVIFGPGEVHKPYVEEFTVIRVYFYNK